MTTYDTEGRVLLDLIRQHQDDLRRGCHPAATDCLSPGQQEGLARRALLVVADNLISLGQRIREHYGRPVSAGPAWSA
jgi:hypothetical protein